MILKKAQPFIVVQKIPYVQNARDSVLHSNAAMFFCINIKGMGFLLTSKDGSCPFVAGAYIEEFCADTFSIHGVDPYSKKHLRVALTGEFVQTNFKDLTVENCSWKTPKDKLFDFTTIDIFKYTTNFVNKRIPFATLSAIYEDAKSVHNSLRSTSTSSTKSPVKGNKYRETINLPPFKTCMSADKHVIYVSDGDIGFHFAKASPQFIASVFSYFNDSPESGIVPSHPEKKVHVEAIFFNMQMIVLEPENGSPLTHFSLQAADPHSFFLPLHNPNPSNQQEKGEVDKAKAKTQPLKPPAPVNGYVECRTYEALQQASIDGGASIVLKDVLCTRHDVFDKEARLDVAMPDTTDGTGTTTVRVGGLKVGNPEWYSDRQLNTASACVNKHVTLLWLKKTNHNCDLRGSVLSSGYISLSTPPSTASPHPTRTSEPLSATAEPVPMEDFLEQVNTAAKAIEDDIEDDDDTVPANFKNQSMFDE